MHVVHVETGRHLYGGAQQVLYLCHGLADNGVQSTLVCDPGGAIDREARDLGLAVENVRCHGDLDLVYRFRLQAALERLAPDVVHCHSRRGGDILGGRAAASAGIPAVVTRRVDSVEPAWAAGFRYRPFRRIVAISENVAASMRASGVSANKIDVIRSAVDVISDDCNRRDWEHEFGVSSERVVAVIAAQLIERKGHRFLFDAMSAICRDHPEFYLIVFGIGPLRSELEDQVTRLGLADHVQFAGFRDDLDGMLACADLLVHPATKEGLGVTMLKGAAAGLPVIAFDVAGAKEAVVHGETGLLVPPGDSQALLQALMDLIENPERRRSLGQAGRQRMQYEFSIGTMVDRYSELYKAVLDKQ